MSTAQVTSLCMQLIADFISFLWKQPALSDGVNLWFGHPNYESEGTTEVKVNGFIPSHRLPTVPWHFHQYLSEDMDENQTNNNGKKEVLLVRTEVLLYVLRTVGGDEPNITGPFKDQAVCSSITTSMVLQVRAL